MPIPNEADATYADQSEIDHGDVQMWEGVAGGYWVVSGGAVTAQGSPDGTVAVAAGTARVGGSNKTISAGNVSVLSGSANPDGSTASAADATLARFDLITINTSSNLGVVHGTPAGLSPNNDGSYLAVFPTYSSKTVLAAIFIPPLFTTVASTMISDKRIPGSVDAMHDQAHNLTGTNHSAGWGGKGYLVLGLTGTTGQTVAPGADGTLWHADSSQTAGGAWVNDLTEKTWTKQGTLSTATGAARWYNDTGRTLTFVSARASVTTVPTGASIKVDVNVDGTTCFVASSQTNRPTIAISGNTNKTTTFDSIATIADGSYVTVDIDQIGSTIAGADLTVTVVMKG